MAFELCSIVIGLIVGFWKKGSIWNIPNLKLKFVWLLPAGYGLETYSIAHLTGEYYRINVILSYTTILIFCVINIRRTGIAWTALGTSANFICMLWNGLRMPAYVPAVQSVAPKLLPSLYAGHIGKSIAMTSHTSMNFLGDIFIFNFYSVTLISIGDILFGAGILLFIQHAMCCEKGGYVNDTGNRHLA